ncbi:hypothetical protein ACB098_12G081600 [Castanea mollissima]
MRLRQTHDSIRKNLKITFVRSHNGSLFETSEGFHGIIISCHTKPSLKSLNEDLPTCKSTHLLSILEPNQGFIIKMKRSHNHLLVPRGVMIGKILICLVNPTCRIFSMESRKVQL